MNTAFVRQPGTVLRIKAMTLYLGGRKYSITPESPPTRKRAAKFAIYDITRPTHRRVREGTDEHEAVITAADIKGRQMLEDRDAARRERARLERAVELSEATRARTAQIRDALRAHTAASAQLQPPSTEAACGEQHSKIDEA